MAKKETTKAVEEKTVEKEGKIKIKKTPKKWVQEGESNITKVDFSKPKEDAVQKQSTNEIPVDDKSTVSKEVRKEDDKKSEEKPTEQKVEQVVEEIKEEPKQEVKKEEPKQQSILEEITEEEQPTVEDIKEKVEEAVVESKETGKQMPENIQKLVDFMDETGGSLEDYIAINQDYSKVDDKEMLRKYYQQQKKHLNDDEINFLIEDNFNYEEDIDDERDVRRKKLAFKEEVAKAREHVSSLKDKYYQEIKSGAKLAPEQQKAVEFFNRYNKEKEQNDKIAQQQKSVFDQKTQTVFNDRFKGFEYKVGEKRYRFNVNNVNEVKDTQSDLTNFVKKFLNKDNVMEDAQGYHKSLFTAMNADAVANHFYEQGKADAIKDTMAKSKNVSMNPRGTHQNVVESANFKVRAVPDPADNSSSFKVRMNKNRNVNKIS